MNNELIPVFDGRSYMDIYVEAGQQMTYSFEIDTADLPDTSVFYAIIAPLDVSDIVSAVQSNKIALLIS